MIRSIVFDMGGVLLSYDPLITCRRLASTPQDAQLIYETLFSAPEWENELDGGLFPEEEMLRIAQDRLATQAQKDLAARAYAQYHQDSLFPLPGMEAVVSLAHDKGFGLYLLTNAGARIYQYIQRLPGYPLFDGFLISSEEKLLKPSAAIYRRLCEKFSLIPEECLFVDDRQVNIDGAKAFGLEGYCFADGDVDRLAAFLKALPNPNA